MADRYDWDRDRERDTEHDRGSDYRNPENRWSQQGQGNRNQNQNFNRDREGWRSGSQDESNQPWSSENRNRENSGRYSETGEQGDWGRQGSWGSFGNRPDSSREGRWNQRESNWNQGREHDYRNESQRGQYSGNYGNYGSGQNQGRDREFGGQFDRNPYNSGAGSFAGSYQGMGQGGGSFGGGMGSYGERGRFSGRGPKGWQRSDERIKEDLSERLADHPHIDASEIEVTVRNGEVTLTGTVEDRNSKRQAEDLAEQVSGVKEVHNQIRVQQQQHAMQGQQSGNTQASSTSGSSTGSTSSSTSGAKKS